MEKIKFELMSKEEFYAVEYKGKDYTLQHTHHMNPDCDDYTIYDVYGDKEVLDPEIHKEILEAFEKL